jgi:putative spermidine/putrescine transport system substrate-binding protein
MPKRSRRTLESNKPAADAKRRRLLKHGLAAGTVALAAPYFFVRVAAAQRTKELVVVHWGGAGGDANRKAYFEPFSKETGIRITEQTGPGMEKVKAQVDVGNVNWDVLVDIGAFRMFQGMQQDLLEKIDYNVVTNTKDLLKYAIQTYGVGSNVGSEVITFNSKKLPSGKQPKTWADFWNVSGVPGHRAMHQKAFGNLEIALIADGVPADKLYPLDVERAFRKLQQLKPHIDVWTTTYDQPLRLLTDGEVDMAPTWNARASSAVDKGAPLGVEWNQGFLYYDMWSVPKGAPNAKAAMQFINFCLDAKRQAEFATLYPYGPVNTKALDMIPANVRAQQPTAPQNLEKQILFDDQWWASRLTGLTERFALWTAQK